MTPLMSKYVFDATMADHANARNFPSMMHATVANLTVSGQYSCRENEEAQRVEYTRILCHLAVSVREPGAKEQWMLIDHLKPNALLTEKGRGIADDLSQHIVAAAVFFKKTHIVDSFSICGNLDFHLESYFGDLFVCAAMSGNDEFFSRFLSSSRVESYKYHYFRPLRLAAEAGHLSTVLLLLLPQYEIAANDSSYEYTIEGAASNGHLPVVECLLNHSTFEAREKKRIIHNAFCLACFNNHSKLALWALENGADINGQVRYRLAEIPLSWAASRGHNDMIRLLLSMGANQHARQPHRPLQAALKAGFARTALLLIDDHVTSNGGGDHRHFIINDKLSGFWIWPLFKWIAGRGHTHVLQLLVDLGFDLETHPEQGRGAMNQAAMNGHQSVIKMLVGMGVEVKDEDVTVAEEYGRDDMVSLLVQLGAHNEVERREDGSKAVGGKILQDKSRNQVMSGAGRIVVDYKRW